jgi:hypothetical protein
MRRPGASAAGALGALGARLRLPWGTGVVARCSRPGRAHRSMELSDAIKAEIKATTSERYKIAVQVHIGAMEGQGLFAASRCLWDEKSDNYVSAQCVQPRPVQRRPRPLASSVSCR